jgi:hypothetical protein
VDPDPYWIRIRIGIQPKMLYPDPDEMNADTQPCSGLKALMYEEKLKELGLTTLEERRRQADTVQVYKIVNGKDKVDSQSWFQLASQTERHTRSSADPLNLRPQAARLDVRGNLFTNRVVEDWNKIPLAVRKVKTVISFKNGYALRNEQEWRKARELKIEYTGNGVGTTPSHRYSLRGPTWATASYLYKTRQAQLVTVSNWLYGSDGCNSFFFPCQIFLVIFRKQAVFATRSID